MRRFIQKSPVTFLQCAVIKPLLCCAIASLSLDHREANASVTKFLTELVKSARKGEKEVSVDVTPPRADESRVRLFD